MLSSSYVLIKFTHQEITWNYDILRSARWSLSRIITISLVKILRVLAVTIENIEVQVNYSVSPSIFNFKYPDIFTFSNYNYLPTANSKNLSPHLDWIQWDTPYLSAFSPNAEKCGYADQNNFDYGHFLRSAWMTTSYQKPGSQW